MQRPTQIHIDNNGTKIFEILTGFEKLGLTVILRARQLRKSKFGKDPG